MRRPDELDKLTEAAREFAVNELGRTDYELSVIDSLIEHNETHAALEGLWLEACHEGVLWPDHLVEQFRDLPERFDLGQEFEEFMECQDNIRKQNAIDHDGNAPTYHLPDTM